MATPSGIGNTTRMTMPSKQDGRAPSFANNAGENTRTSTNNLLETRTKRCWSRNCLALATSMVVLSIFYVSSLQSFRLALGASHPDDTSSSSSTRTDSKYVILDNAAASLAKAAASAAQAAQAATLAAAAAREAASAANKISAGAQQTPGLWAAAEKLPNEGRESGTRWDASSGIRLDSGVRSDHYGGIQRQHQGWLTRKVAGQRGMDRISNTTAPNTTELAEIEERLRRASNAVNLWGETYVPPIEPVRRQEMIDKWSGKMWSPPANRQSNATDEKGGGTATPLGRILYVISSFDRGQRLGKAFTQLNDKLDYILMMMDEMREACEVGFSPEVHLIAAWDPSDVVHLIRDRLFCVRTGSHVPFSFKDYPHDVGDNLSIKHRIFMKPRLEEFDIFLQVEDDMVLTLNHILLYQEESELLDNRDSKSKPNREKLVPGFIRVEPEPEVGGAVSGDKWVEWEIMLSRFHPMKVAGADTYLTLGKAVTAPLGSNNQGLWMATREQLRMMSAHKKCRYLEVDENTGNGHPEFHSGSIQMFTTCEFKKVIPATHFEDFLVHHRANNKADKRGESIPAVRVRMLRTWVEQFLRDDGYLPS
ncbi:unnamed protein product [Pylaiella littoralis]